MVSVAVLVDCGALAGVPVSHDNPYLSADFRSICPKFSYVLALDDQIC